MNFTGKYLPISEISVQSKELVVARLLKELIVARLLNTRRHPKICFDLKIMALAKVSFLLPLKTTLQNLVFGFNRNSTWVNLFCISGYANFFKIKTKL